MSTDCELCAALGVTRDATRETPGGRYVCDDHADTLAAHARRMAEPWAEDEDE